ncbi:MAG TPA: flagellar hook-associated protein FlgL [Candidatus Krumholzibacteria bacterium]|nr:flagellar hook-associated protein FlgL [Candidatus Krumholzibacteria bacterium]HPD71654.1 flagellar hook-associated protein FlgL [Candidatus Krumholzibacteria bacterium]HRY41413.1 flagellar hook-associated protein FlgL [Candidatus Krumholzibacteria bacterium]
MPIRISDNYLSQILVGDLNRSLGNMLELQRQAGTMLRVNDFADDPRAVGAIQRYNALIANNSQYLRNLSRSSIIVDSTDTALQDVSDVLAEIRELALRESSAIATAQSRQTAVVQVENLVNRLLDVLNTTVEGNYIFGGTRTDTPPFVRNGSTVIYQGNEHDIITQVGPNATQIVNIPGCEFMGSMSATLGGSVDLAPRLAGMTPLADLNLGAGWQAGSLAIRDGNNDNWTIDLSACITVDDAIAAIDAATGGAVTASLNPDGTGLQLSGTGPLVVSDVGDSQTATSLGINGRCEAGVFSGRDIRAALSPAVLLTDIAALDGSLPLGAIELEVGGVATTVDFAAAATLGDLQAIFGAALPGYELRLDSAGLSVVSGSTETFIIRNTGATDTASLLGIEGTGTPARLFGVLEELAAALAADDPDAIRGLLVEVDALEQMLQTQLIKVGGRQQDFDWTEALLMQRDTQLRAKLSLERDADVAQVSVDLAAAQMSYQSSLLVTSRLFQANLMMYL